MPKATMPRTSAEANPARSPDLAGAERKSAVGGVALRIGIGAGRDAQRPGMRRHVETVRQQGHRAVEQSREDLAGHHDGGKRHDPQRPPGVVVVGAAQKIMVVRQVVRLGSGHGQAYFE
jgi:hypothetical protein